MIKSWWLGAYAVLAALHVLGVASDSETLSWATKPLLMPVLAVWLYQQTKGSSSALRSGWLAGLAFSTLGDVLLQFPGSLYFLLGLSAFLLAHLSFIAGINLGLKERRGYLKQQMLWLLPLLAYPLLLLFWLWDGIPAGMRAPVAVYASVISTMLASVVNLRGHIPAPVFNTLLPGALLFVLSDSLIAVSKFGHPFAGAPVAIIVTYIAGQYLLVRGVRVLA